MAASHSSIPTGSPTRTIDVRRAGLRAGIALDLATADAAFPMGRLVVPLLAIAAGLGVGWARPGYTSIYGESLAVIAILVAIGTFGRTIGALTAIAYGAADLAHFLAIPDATIGAQVSRDTFLGRLAALEALWIAIVVVPSVARQIEALLEARGGDGLPSRVAGAAAGGVVAGAGMYLWSNVMPYLIRPAFKYSPPPQVLQPQAHPQVMAVAVGAAYVLVALALRRRTVDRIEREPLLGRLTGLGAVLYRIALYAALLLLMLGLISGPLDVAVLVASFVVAEAGATAVARAGRPGAAPRVSGLVIAVGGLVLALAATVVVGRVAGGMWPKGLGDSLFFPIVLAVAVSYPIARIAFALAATRRGPARPVPGAVAAAGVVGLLALAFLAVPSSALADNCSNLDDCYYQLLFLSTLLGFGGLFAAAASSASQPQQPAPPPPAPPPPQDPDWEKKLNKSRRDYFDKQLQQEKKNPRYPDNPKLQNMRNRYFQQQRDYWNNPTPPNPGPPISPEAFPSSGAGTVG